MRKIHLFWGLLTAALTVLGLALCALGLSRGTLAVKTNQEPGQEIIAFFEELSTGEPEAAYERLYNYKTLGLENSPRSEDGARLLEALRESYRCGLLGPAELEGDRAVQPVRLHFLDLDALEERIRSGEFADIESALASHEDLTAQADLRVTLRYDGSRWLLELDPAVLDVIQGHVPGEGSL